MQTEQLDDGLSDDNRVTTYRARLKGMLDHVAAEAKQRLADENLDIPLFFLLPSSGMSILSFGTVRDPDDTIWRRVEQIVATIIEASIGIPRVRCREMLCAATDDAGDQQPSVQSPPVLPEAEEAEPDNRFLLPASHPILAEVAIDPADWDRFEEMADENPAIRLLGRDDPYDEKMVVYIACASRKTRDRLQDGWS
jgi:hypothetical protein